VQRSILLLPPWAEELNRCRYWLACQARYWQQQGIATLIVDLYGTGDSHGDFADARLDIWHDNLNEQWQWLTEQTGVAPWLWAVRGGSLFLPQLMLLDSPGWLLWQPLLRGDHWLNQWLRMKFIQQQMTKQPVTMGNLRQQLMEQGLTMGGYFWSAALAKQLTTLRLDAAGLLPKRIIWQSLQTLSPAEYKLLIAWQQTTHCVHNHWPSGPFWQMPAALINNELLQAPWPCHG